MTRGRFFLALAALAAAPCSLAGYRSLLNEQDTINEHTSNDPIAAPNWDNSLVPDDNLYVYHNVGGSSAIWRDAWLSS